MIWIILIPLIAFGLQGISIGAELLMHDREKAKELELAIKRKQRQLKEFQKKKQTKEMMATQKEVFGLMGRKMRLQMKSWIISMPLFFIAFIMLSGFLVYQPAYVGEPFEVGVFLKNLEEKSQILNLTLVPKGDMSVVDALKSIELDESGDKGDIQTIWWEASAPSTGDKEYYIDIAVDGSDEAMTQDSRNYTVKVIQSGELIYSFSPQLPSEEIGNLDIEVSPRYRELIFFNLFGFDITWFWHYLLSFFIISAAMLPLKNRVLWGHWKGVKYLEKMESEKNGETNKEQE